MVSVGFLQSSHLKGVLSLMNFPSARSTLVGMLVQGSFRNEESIMAAHSMVPASAIKSGCDLGMEMDPLIDNQSKG